MSKRELVNELHRDARRNFKRRKFDMQGITDTLQADLVEMLPYSKYNNGMRYLLTVINIFSKKAYVRALKNKTGPEVTRAMASVVDSLEHPIERLHVDNGKEFYNAHMQKMLRDRNIHMYSTYTTKKAAIVERFNRTLKNRMWKEFSYRGSYKWIDMIQMLVHEYNETKHRTIKCKPNDVNPSNEHAILRYAYNNRTVVIKRKPRFKVGDQVRMSKYKKVFYKGYTPNWTTEIFKIKKVQPTNPITYLLIDSDGHDIKGTVYEEELQLVKQPGLYLVEKILKKRGSKVFVKWLGFDDQHNSWVDEKDVL